MINTILGILFFLVAITIIVVIHEFGHLIVAKRNGVKCFEFSVGMGPKIFTFYTDKSGTKYNLRAIPIGGFVMMAGEEESTEMEFEADQSLMNKHPWQKLKILFAGAAMNFILGFIILFLSFFLFGVQTPQETNEIIVSDNSPAQIAGIQSGDQILKINDTNVSNFNQISDELEKNQKFEIKYSHLGNEKVTTVTKQQINCEKSIVGISPKTETKKFRLIDSIKHSFNSFIAIFASIGQSLQLLFNGTAGVSDLMGPLGMASASKSVVSMGIKSMLLTIAFLSINIGVVNILPFPALDGGRMVLALFELITKKRVPEKLELFLNLIGFVCLMLLFVFVTFADVGRIGTEEYFDLNISTQTTCAQGKDEVKYNLRLEPTDDKMPENIDLRLKSSDGADITVNDGVNQSEASDGEIEVSYSKDYLNDNNGLEAQVTIKTKKDQKHDLDLVVKVFDEKNDTINEQIYRVER